MQDKERRDFALNFIAHEFPEYDKEESNALYRGLLCALDWGFKSSYTPKELKAMEEQKKEAAMRTNQERNSDIFQRSTAVKHIRATDLF